VGYTLDEIANDITLKTPASFEPTIDYVVTKIPRFTFEKFPAADNTLTTQMKSVGEVMAIGRTFKESLQKAIRSLEIDSYGLEPRLESGLSNEELLKRDAESRLHAGVWELDPVFETNILAEDGCPPRLYYSRLDRKGVMRMPAGIGPQRTWVGTFAQWMEDEAARGAITQEQCARLVDLEAQWLANPDPAANGEAKLELTECLRKLVGR
jgi:hypothetical protein